MTFVAPHLLLKWLYDSGAALVTLILKAQFFVYFDLVMCTLQGFLFTGNALLRRLVRIGVLDESKMKLDYVLGLRVDDFLERRLQTQVFKLGLAKSIHHARVLIRQRHIR